MIKWKDMTSKQLERVSQDLSDHAHDLGIDREHMIEEVGFDVVEATECVARRLDREATRRARKASLGLMEEVVIEGHGWMWTVHVRYDAKHEVWDYKFLPWNAPPLVATSETLSGMLYAIVERVARGREILDEAIPDLLKLRRDARKRRVEQVEASFKETVEQHVAELTPDGFITKPRTASGVEALKGVLATAENDAKSKGWIKADGVVVAHVTDITFKGDPHYIHAGVDFIGDDAAPSESSIYVGPNGCAACGNAPGERHAVGTVGCEGAS